VRATRPGVVVLALGTLLGGCTTPPRLPSTSGAAADLLTQADALAERGDYAAALPVYDQVVDRYANTQAASHARVLREASATILKLRTELESRETELDARDAELATLQRDLSARESDLGRVQRELAGREAELSRLRAEVVARQAEIARLATESERLKADIDQLKRIDLRLEQQRRR